MGLMSDVKTSGKGFEYVLAKKRNSKYFSTFLVMALTCALSIFLLYSKSVITLHNSYSDYNSASQAASDIRKNLLLSQLTLVDFLYSQNKQNLDNIVTQSNHADNEIKRAFELLEEEFWSDNQQVNTIKTGYLGWLSIRDNIIAQLRLNEKQHLLLPLVDQNTQKVIAINRQLEVLTKALESNTQDIIQRPYNQSLESLRIELLISVLLIICLAIIFYTFQNRITKDKQAISSALAWSNRLLDSSPDAMIISDRDGVISQVNKNAEALFGYSKNEFVNLNIAKLMPQRFANHHEKIALFFKHSSSREMGLGKTLYALNSEGKEFPVEISLNLAELNERKVAITVIRDVSEKKKSEAKLIHQANCDLLTKLPNRKLINDRLD